MIRTVRQERHDGYQVRGADAAAGVEVPGRGGTGVATLEWDYLAGRFCSSLFCEQPLSLKIAQAGFLGSLSGILARRHFSQEIACSDVARALVPAGVPLGRALLPDASFDTVSQPRTRIEMSLDTAGRVPAPHRLAEV